MKLIDLKVDRIRTPLGFYTDKPVFSWAVEDTAAKRQTAAQVVVSTSADLSAPLFDTGKSAELSSLGVEFPCALSPRTRYYWSVIVWGDNGETATAASWFETGKMGEPWQAKWIAAPMHKDAHPQFVKPFILDADVVRARLYCTALGMYEAELNGKKAGDEYLAPACNDYHNFLQIHTYDVTDLVHSGENRLGVWLGQGWYAGKFGWGEPGVGVWGDDLALLAELVVELADGTTVTIGTDESWLCHASAVVKSGIYYGEDLDARMENRDWSRPEGDLTGWLSVVPAEVPAAPLTDRWSLPIVIKQRWTDFEVLTTPAGETVFDFKQEMTGWVEFDCQLPAGTKLQLQFGELLQHGNFYNENLRSAEAQYTYIADGVRSHVRPRFTFYGFRFMKVTGAAAEDLQNLTACVVYSDMDSTGDIITSNEKVNRLIANVQWGQRGNFLDVPTDWPQRDERLGWTGDAQIFCGTANFNMDTAAFYSKYLHDMLLEQRELNGSAPHFVPDITMAATRRKGEKPAGFGACAWSDAATIIPWNNYLYFGSKVQLAREYENMKLWTDYIKTRDEEMCGGRRLWACDFHYGDWLAMDNPDKDSRFGNTDDFYLASGYYYWAATLTAKAAAVLGKTEDAAYYRKLAEEVLAAIRSEYFTPTGRLACPTQTAHAMALFMGLVPEEFKARTIEELGRLIKKRSDHLDTGFIGTYQLCSALSENGLAEVMYTLLLNEDLPSWLYEVNMGATTIWERWNSVLPNGLVSDTGMNSMNHYSYGAVMEWMYRYMCGILPREEAPGFKRVTIRPMPDARFDHACARYNSAAGKYVSGWKKTDAGMEYEVTVPFDAEAEFVLVNGGSAVTVNGEACAVLAETGRVTLSAGSYVIAVKA